jgi:branched-chain amino acid transport system permease protein
VSDLLALVTQQTVNGVYLGCLYVMVALGLTLIYGVLNQINFAHADFVTVGAFAAFFTATRFATRTLGLPDTGGYLLSLVAALGAGALLGFLVNATVFAPLRSRGDELRPLIATIGESNW